MLDRGGLEEALVLMLWQLSNSTFRVRKRDLRKSHSQAPGARATPSRATHVATEGQRSFDWARVLGRGNSYAALTDPLVCRAAAAVSASRSPDNSNSARQTCTCIACYRPNAQLPPAAQSVGRPTPRGGRMMASFHGGLDSGRSRRGEERRY